APVPASRRAPGPTILQVSDGGRPFGGSCLLPSDVRAEKWVPAFAGTTVLVIVCTAWPRSPLMIEQTLDIATEDGAMEAFICHPERGGPFPAVLLLMDAPGIREELRDMARRLGTVGYYVLLPNLYYRPAGDPTFVANLADGTAAGKARIRPVGTKMRIPRVWADPVATLPSSDGKPEVTQGQAGRAA